MAGLPVCAADLSPQLQAVRALVENKKYAEAIAQYEKLLQEASRPLQGPVQFEIAALHATMGNADRALAMMDQAVQSGFDDCLAIAQRQELKLIQGDPRFLQPVSRIRISEPDRKELFWLKAEILNVSHDTKMMITENVNRVDTGITVVPQSLVPVRETSSPGVLFHRELLRMMQQSQIRYVFEADKLRMRHVTNMRIITGGASAQQVAISLRFAASNAEERKRSIEARKFSLSPATDPTPRPCSDYK